MSIKRKLQRELPLLARLRRYPQQGWLGGVCAGLAEYFEFNATLLRIIFVFGFFFSGFFPVAVAYLLLWYAVDAESYEIPHSSAYHRAPTGPRSGGPAPARQAGRVRERFARLEQRLQTMEACVTSHEFKLRRELRDLE